jgi:hypothetical protein
MLEDRASVEDSLIGLEPPTGSSKKIGSGGDGCMIGVVFEPKRGFRLSAMLMFLMLAGLPAYAQSGTGATPTSPP